MVIAMTEEKIIEIRNYMEDFCYRHSNKPIHMIDISRHIKKLQEFGLLQKSVEEKKE